MSSKTVTDNQTIADLQAAWDYWVDAWQRRASSKRPTNRGQAQLGVQGLDQHQAAVGAGVWPVEAGDDRLRKPIALEGQLGNQSVAVEPPCHGA